MSTQQLESYAISTYRLLRGGMVVLLLALGVAVLIEYFHTNPRCLQTSISAYYYTPARAVFVGVLVGLSLGMIAVKGNTPWEDVLLNNAGLLAPVVALVPTTQVAQCFSTVTAKPDVGPNVSNNIPAAAFVGALSLIAWVAVSRARITSHGKAPWIVGSLLAAIELVGIFGWFLIDRSSFIGHAHDVSAITMFAFVVAVVLVNAHEYGQITTGSDRKSVVFRNRYTVLAILMVVAPLILWVVSRIVDWATWLTCVETTMLTLFAAFWVLQTAELWHEGVRKNPGQPHQT